MAYFYIDDGYPESDEYGNNYIYFNAQDPGSFQKMIKLAQELKSVPSHEQRLIIERFKADLISS